MSLNPDQMLRAAVHQGQVVVFLPDGRPIHGLLAASVATPRAGEPSTVTLAAVLADETHGESPANQHEPAGSGGGWR